ncbi:ferritin-like domain-containing protein [Peristeroidobacter soli]|uniref:ferritin-like domain-containing protein n=1 Tax=Peristeroidobacter soli TaxID=2497877 RepID=UPI00101C7009|nr:ferritin-like domain-containing protein [Peristeroidobacter soli]
MDPTAASATPSIDTEALGLDEGALLLVRRALAQVPVGGNLLARGRAPNWELHLTAWCRQQGHAIQTSALSDGVCEAIVTRGPWAEGRWRDALTAGQSQLPAPSAKPEWGLAARGATVEAGSPAFNFTLSNRDELWATTADEIYAQGVAAQWDPQTAIDWDTPFEIDPEIEAAVVQVMTFLVENENAALIVPARHLGQLHPHYREVQQVLALQCADEARHVEVFTRRLGMRGRQPMLSTAGGQASLRTLLQAPDFSSATFLLSVLGEGTFVNLLSFLHEYGPDPVTRQICRLAARDEARHVAFGMAHLKYRLSVEPDYLARLQNAIEQRHEALAPTSGLNEEVFDALILIAAGSLTPAAIARGYAAVQRLKLDMAAGRKSRLLHLGFPADQAQRLADLHTRNFM